MREYLFRGKRVSNKEWVEGSLLTTAFNSFIIPIYDEFIKYQEPISVDKDTVGQFIGLTDKNGVKIFEGDMISAPHFDLLFVGYDKAGASFACVKNIADLEVSRCYWFGNDILIKDGWEVIGNIHDNPELINKITL